VSPIGTRESTTTSVVPLKNKIDLRQRPTSQTRQISRSFFHFFFFGGPTYFSFKIQNTRTKNNQHRKEKIPVMRKKQKHQEQKRNASFGFAIESGVYLSAMAHFYFATNE
jgi:hypothetical protein